MTRHVHVGSRHSRSRRHVHFHLTHKQFEKLMHHRHHGKSLRLSLSAKQVKGAGLWDDIKDFGSKVYDVGKKVYKAANDIGIAEPIKDFVIKKARKRLGLGIRAPGRGIKGGIVSGDRILAPSLPSFLTDAIKKRGPLVRDHPGIPPRFW